jgi:hypothetical protein
MGAHRSKRDMTFRFASTLPLCICEEALGWVVPSFPFLPNFLCPFHLVFLPSTPSPLPPLHPVQGFPTVLWFRDGIQRTYHGGRDEESLVTFASRLLGPPAATMKTAKEVEGFIASAPVTFILHLTPKPTELGDDLVAAYHPVAADMQGSQVFAVAHEPAEEDAAWVQATGRVVAPCVAKHQVGEAPVMWVPLEQVTQDALGQWISDNHFETVTELGPSNFHSILRAGRMLAVAITNPSDRSTPRFKSAFQRHLASPSTSTLPPAVAAHFYFGVLDGVRFEKYIGTLGLSPRDLPRLVVLDAAGGVHYDDASVDEVDEMDTFLREIVAGETPRQRAGALRYPQLVLNMFLRNFPLSLLVAVPVVALVGAVLYFLLRMCFAGDEDEDEDEEEGGDEGSAEKSSGHGSDSEEDADESSGESGSDTKKNR